MSSVECVHYDVQSSFEMKTVSIKIHVYLYYNGHIAVSVFYSRVNIADAVSNICIFILVIVSVHREHETNCESRLSRTSPRTCPHCNSGTVLLWSYMQHVYHCSQSYEINQATPRKPSVLTETFFQQRVQ